MNGVALNGLRVLVVEDEMLVCMDLMDMLSELGCIVVGPAARVEQALGIVEREPIDLAMLDINLGRETSYPIAERLAALGIPYFFSTGYSLVESAFENKPRLQKPFSERQLSSVLMSLGGSIHSS
ncbi:response regulator [Limimaricola litoreus]|uniref:Response regulator n=1 Tax=Limimaricola litoreus TaxID=2955316 RepID=A0A9X2FPI5_9RHOB|nr:response regulator [Limimaricola litoreus]MCP1167364.1 response regulator [Limimaricola litoreus]